MCLADIARAQVSTNVQAPVSTGKGPLLTLNAGNYPITFLSWSEFEQLERLGRVIEKVLPKEKYAWVGVGSGLDEVVTYLEQLHPGNVYRAPIRGMSQMEVMAPFLGETLLPWLAQWIPSSSTLAGRDVAFLDYMETGGSLHNTMALAKQLYRGTSTEVRGFGLTTFLHLLGRYPEVHLESVDEYPDLFHHAASFESRLVAKYLNRTYFDHLNGEKPELQPLHHTYVDLLKLRIREAQKRRRKGAR